MIDPHVHLRDWNQKAKETLRHGLSVAYRAGLDAVFEMPNTDPPLTSRDAIERRIDEADGAIAASGLRIFHGLYAGLTSDPAQIEAAVRARADLFPRVVGLKMFAGHSTGNMGIEDLAGQRAVYRRLASLGYRGVLAVHAEKESLLAKRPDGSADWDPRAPASHSAARPPESEIASVADQIELARAEGFPGILHIVHVSVPAALDRIRLRREEARDAGDAPRITCGVTPHHVLLDRAAMDGRDGILLKMNPPLRERAMRELMLAELLGGGIDWIETDHAPHTLEDKKEGHASGIPVLPFTPRFLRILRREGMAEEAIDRLTHGAIASTFGIAVASSRRSPDFDLAGEYEFDPFASLGS